MGDRAASSSSIGDVDALTTKLIDEFRSTLDDTLIIAILSDFDLTEQFFEAHGILSSLAQNASSEEASLADQAYLNNTEQSTIRNYVPDLAGLERPDSSEPSQGTTDSAQILSDSTSDTDWDFSLVDRFADLEIPQDVNIAMLGEEGKVDELKLMFTGLSDFDLKFALKKANGDFAKACEELLNLQYLEENGLRPKGIDGAFRDDRTLDHLNRYTTPKGKDKGKNRLDVDYRLTPVDLSERDDGLSSKAHVAHSLVRRSSLPRILTSQAVAEKTTASAPISPVIKPTDWQTVRPRKKTYNELAQEAAASRAFANRTLEAASSAYRRGKSDALYRPVAGVLAERAKEQRAHARRIEVQQYEAYVDRSASTDSIDLHGIPVADGVRIALDKTHTWWINLGEDRAKKAKLHGFVVVTGLGNHSASGVSRMRQEVGAALKREGWRVSVETGQYVVLGKA